MGTATKQSTKKISASAKNTKATGKPEYQQITITCACGATFESGSTMKKIHVDICSKCHPFFTGEKKIVDTEGRVEKFKKKYNML